MQSHPIHAGQRGASGSTCQPTRRVLHQEARWECILQGPQGSGDVRRGGQNLSSLDEIPCDKALQLHGTNQAAEKVEGRAQAAGDPQAHVTRSCLDPTWLGWC